MEKFVWLNIERGCFSNSWVGDIREYYTEKDMENMKNSGWKLIKFDCLNDPKFDFNCRMKIK